MTTGRTFFIALLILAGVMQGCNYSKSYFRIDPATGKKIKAEGPIVPGEDLQGTTGGGDQAGDEAIGDTGPTGGTGDGGEEIAPEDSKEVPAIPVYPLAIHAKDLASNAQNLYFARFSEGALEAPKKLTENTDDKKAIMFPALSPDATKILYMSLSDGGSNLQLRLVKSIPAGPVDQEWNAGEPGVSPSWTADGQEAVYVSGGCGLLRKAKVDAPAPADEATAPAGDYDKWIYFQTFASPVTEASHPAHGQVLFSMFSAESAATQGFDLFLKTLGDTDPSHFRRITDTPQVVEFYPSISPDGKYVAFGAIDAAQSDNASDAPQKIAVCDLAFPEGGAKCENTRTFDAMPAGSVNSSPCWAWDSSKIFFTSKDATSKKYDVFVVDFTGGQFGASAVNLTQSDGLDEMEVSCASAQTTK